MKILVIGSGVRLVWKFAFVLVTLTLNLSAQEFRLPFNGRWFVMQGGDTLNVNQHMQLPAQSYGLDLVKVGGVDGRSLAKTDGKQVEDYYSWGESVLSPVDGKIIAVVDNLPDNPLGEKDPKHAGGNHVVIQAAASRFVFLCHFQKSSLRVKVGDEVKTGQPLARCGNSGNSDFPHVHMHVQNTPKFNQGTGQNVTFKHINVELSGKYFENVDWPLIRGLFVSNK